MVPFFLFYSMFGFQRIGDLIWAAGDSQARGFLLGGTAGRTTLAGEGLQHQDGHSHVIALTNPSVMAYDPAFAFELAVIVQEGLRRMLEEGENLIYYLTLMNEFYRMPSMPDDAKDGILKGLYKFRAAENSKAEFKAHLLGSGAILNEALKAQEILADDYGIAADVYSITSYKNLYIDAIETERRNMMHPDKAPDKPYVGEVLKKERGVFVAASDYSKVLPASITNWIPGRVVTLGTDGYGRSDTRASLRNFFEVDARHIVYAAIAAMVREGKIDPSIAVEARRKMDIDPEKSSAYFH